MNRICTSLLVLALLSWPLAASAASKSYLVLTKGQGQGSTAIADAIAAAGGTIDFAVEEVGMVVATSEDPGFLAAIGQDSRVKEAAEDVEVQWLPDEDAEEATGLEVNPDGVNSDPLTGYQWNLWQIGAFDSAAAGDLGWGVTRARVAVLDSGIWSTHPDIKANLNVGLSRSFVPSEPGINPVVYGFNHGTHVAGIIAAPVNNSGVQGVAPLAEIVAIKVLSSQTGSGSFSGIVAGLVYAASIQADVANMSLGATFDRINAGGGGAGPLLAALNRAINYATQQGVLCVSAAGNESVDLDSRLVSIPAQSGNGMAVSATGPIAWDDFDRLASYSNWGRSVVNVAAPGGDAMPGGYYPYDMVLSPGGISVEPDGLYWAWYFAAGTSMAAPHVSGLAALLVGKYGKMSPTHLRQLIEQGAVDILKPGADPESGRGRIDVGGSLY
ncbi:MAG: S8 family serine peptidase [Myxococcota bacterium]|jgi:subtilisin family serine protease|nr:S8 family serine peptidase [Myxococcota bacterium]